MSEVVVIGSGPAGVACASALLQQGKRVLMLDAGLSLEPERAHQAESLRATSPGEWTADLLAAAKGNTTSSAKGIPLKMLFGSDFPYRDAVEKLHCDIEKVGLRPSLALGGFSNVWGAAMLPYIDADMPDWPVKADRLAQHYAAVTGLTGLAGEADLLEETFPLYTNQAVPLRLSRQAQAVLDKLERNKATLARKGIRFGKSRLAVKSKASPDQAGCNYCQMCMYGCPYGYIYNSADTVRELQRNSQFTYRPGILVDRVEEFPTHSALYGRGYPDGGSVELMASRVYLAAGTLSSTRILLESLGAHDRPVFIKDSQYWLVPMLAAKKVPGVRHEALQTLSQLFLEINNLRINPFTVHLQLYSYNDLISGALRASLGFIGKHADFLIREFEGRLLVAQGYLHSDCSSRIEATLTGDRKFLLRPDFNRGTRANIRKVLWQLFQSAPSLGMAPLAPMLQISEPGRGYHCGGSFPMRKNPTEWFETDVLGRPVGRERIHVVDSTVFPSIPATTITFTAMANAHRIGWESSALAS